LLFANGAKTGRSFFLETMKKGNQENENGG